MATTPVWVPLVVAFLGLGGILLAQYFTHRREDVRWSREHDREEAAWAHEDAARSDERMQQHLVDSYLEVLRIIEAKASGSRPASRTGSSQLNWPKFTPTATILTMPPGSSAWRSRSRDR
ncbi:MAG: hypothetical protein WAK86_15500 [Pseudonocardiaceae bacterium]